MKALKLFVLVAILIPCELIAANTDTAGQGYFLQAKQHLENMLSGKEPPNYEEAIFQIENAWHAGRLSYNAYEATIDFQTEEIRNLITIYRDSVKMSTERDLLQTAELKKENYQRALSNFAIYKYMTSTSLFHLPYKYTTHDPLGTIDWKTTQVTHLITTGDGNCYALASLYKIFADRLNSNALLCTAPGHIYIRHADEKGTFYNIELASRAFPGTGTLGTLTYSTNEEIKNNIALRELDLKQSISLCLVYLAKGYEYKFHVKNSDFMLLLEIQYHLISHKNYRAFGRNDLCPCGSREKYKKCCLLKEGVKYVHYEFIVNRPSPEVISTSTTEIRS